MRHVLGRPVAVRTRAGQAADPRPDHTKTFRTAIKDGNTPDLAGLNVDLTDAVRQLGDDRLKLSPYSVDGVSYGLESGNASTLVQA